VPRRSPTPSKVSEALARDRLGVTGVMFFILAGVAPLTVTAGVVPTAYAVTGLTSVPAAFLVVAVVLGVFAVGYVAMAQRIPNAGGAHDMKALQARIVQLKSQFPDNLDASVLAEPNTPYDTLVQVMDAVRGTMTAQGPRIVRTELFPNISIGDAPVVKR